jgi:IS5 family transposase
MLTEAGGIPVGVVVAGANRHDMKLTRETIESIAVSRPEPGEGEEQGVCVDKGYDYDEVSQILEEFGFTAHIRARARKRRPSGKRLGSRPGGGWWSARTVGWTGFGGCWCGGRSKRRITWGCYISPVVW